MSYLPVVMDRDKLKAARSRLRVRIEASADEGCAVGYSAFALGRSLIEQGYAVEVKLAERPRPRPTLRLVA